MDNIKYYDEMYRCSIGDNLNPFILNLFSMLFDSISP
jgi:hypothetical protein